MKQKSRGIVTERESLPPKAKRRKIPTENKLLPCREGLTPKSYESKPRQKNRNPGGERGEGTS